MTEERDFQAIEIKGVKFEVDMRTAKRIENFRVGDRVKVLIKEYSETHSIYPGIICGFENFKKLPTIVVCYLKSDYSSSKLEFLNYNTETKDLDMVKADDSYLPIEKDDVLVKFDKVINKAQEEVEELQRKERYFIEKFQKYFEFK